MSAPSRISVVIPMYRDGARALSTSRSMARQALPAGTELEVIVVDDGSNDGSAELLAGESSLRLVRFPENRGRSAARNAGAAAATGSVIVFMDCDCEPTRNDFLLNHLTSLASGGVASTGHVTGTGEGFWHRYQQEASARRERQHALGLPGSGSSQNFAVHKAAFAEVGGFDEAFRRYGFEDRDLLLRLSAIGKVVWTREAVVRHLDEISLSEVSRKMMEAGCITAPLFSARHPASYQALGYAGIDAEQHPWLRPVGLVLGPVALRAGKIVDPLLRRKWFPYGAGKPIVRVASALSFLYGTVLRARPNV
ncbi:glycosyltransferase family 2 protein [Lysobacter terrae]